MERSSVSCITQICQIYYYKLHFKVAEIINDYLLLKQVQQLFPHFPRNLIVEDLRVTRSVEWTVENILDGVLIPPHHLIEEPQSESVPQIRSTTEISVPLNIASTQSPSDSRFDIPMADR